MDTLDNHNAFTKGIPTLFVLDTPFQLLCAMEFLAEFAVEDYLIIAQMERGEKRNEQVLHMLKEQGMKYQVAYVEDYWGMVNACLQLDVERRETKDERKWERVVVGNYNALDQWVTVTRLAAEGAKVVFLDDGSSSIELLNAGHGRNSAQESQFMTLWCKMGLDCGPYIYTTYGDIPSNRFMIYPNRFAHLVERMGQFMDEKAVYIIGTNPPSYQMSMGITTAEYEKILLRKLTQVKRKHKEQIIYIPHGRDNGEVSKRMCKCLGIAYCPLTCAIEYYFVGERKGAVAIYGFGSTALLTLKMLLPGARVVNWLIDNPKGSSYETYVQIANYYCEHGVDIDKIPAPKVSILRRGWRLIKRIF